MFNSSILEVIIGMIFIYSLLSVLVTQINTISANLLKLRARHLRGSLEELLSDPEILAKVMTHPLIRMVNVGGRPVLPDQQLSQEDARNIIKAPVDNVEYISPSIFVDVLVALLRVDADNELFGAMLNIIDGMPSGPERRTLRLQINRLMTNDEGLDALRETIQNLREPIYREALLDALDQIDEEISRMGMEGGSLISLIAGLRRIDNPYFRATMETLLTTADSMATARTHMEEWFNDGMSRATAAYKRSMGAISIISGLLIALLLNVDSLHIAQTLWNDPALRGAVAAAAQTANLEAMISEAEADLQAALNPDPAIPDPNADPNAPLDDVASSFNDARQTLDMFLALRLPLGWSFEDLSRLPANDPLRADSRYWFNLMPANNGDWLLMWVSKVIGWLATVIAIAQGAPFWFNMLNRFSGRGGASA